VTSLFDSIKQGLTEAIEYERGDLKDIRVDKVTVASLRSYSSNKVKEIRTRLNMTQKLFAAALGVSVKTVEAWESGTNTPSGCASRMLELLDRDDSLLEKYAIIARQ
jgi:putative transcriptional regulator